MLHPVVIQKESEETTGEPDSSLVHGTNKPPNDNNNVRLVAVLEFIKEIAAPPKEDGKEDRGGFNEEDEEIADSYSVWGEVASHYADLYSRIERQRNLSGFLLNVVRYVFNIMVSV